MRTDGPAHYILKIRNLRVELPTRQGSVRAVDNVSLALQKGRTLGLVGESGCGKSMLARAIMGLLPANASVSREASMEFDGRDLTRMNHKQLREIVGRHIGLVFQDPMTSLNPVMPIGRQVAEGIRFHLGATGKDAMNQAIALLDRVGIPIADRRAKQYPHQLSGGLRQRVAIAIALACKPKLLIADEPTTALDVTVQAEILNLLSDLQRERQMTMILITHDLGVVARWTQETAVMYAGQIVEHAATSALFKHMYMPYTRALMNAVPRLSNPPHTRLEVIDGRPPDLIAISPGCRFAPRCWKARPPCGQREPELKQMDGSKHRFKCWYPLNANG